MWAIVETYYKHGEYKLIIIQTEDELRNYILEQLKYYEIKLDGDEDLCVLMDLVLEQGQNRIDEQLGWGVREIRYINLNN